MPLGAWDAGSGLFTGASTAADMVTEGSSYYGNMKPGTLEMDNCNLKRPPTLRGGRGGRPSGCSSRHSRKKRK